MEKIKVGIFYREAAPYVSQLLREYSQGVKIIATAESGNNSSDPSDMLYDAQYEIQSIPPTKKRAYIDSFAIPKTAAQDPDSTLYSNLTGLVENLEDSVKPVIAGLKKQTNSNRRKSRLVFLIHKR